jgi:hypothetical protein
MKRGDTLKIIKPFRADHADREIITISYLILAVNNNIITVRAPAGHIVRLNILNFKLS